MGGRGERGSPEGTLEEVLSNLLSPFRTLFTKLSENKGTQQEDHTFKVDKHIPCLPPSLHYSISGSFLFKVYH